MIDFLRLKNLGGDFSLFERAAESKNAAVFALSAGSKIHMAAELNRFVLYVVPDRLAAQTATERFNAYEPSKTVLIPERDDVLLHRRTNTKSNAQGRIDALEKILSKEARRAVISAEALLQLFPAKDRFDLGVVRICVNDEIDILYLTELAVNAGYVRADTVTEKGVFAVRGDIFDIFPVNRSNPVRLSFFGDTVEEIREFDAETGVSTGKPASVALAPCSDILLTPEEAAAAVKRLERLDPPNSRTREIIADLIFRLGLKSSDSSYVWLLPFIRKSMCGIFAYLPEDAVICFDEPKLVNEKIELYYLEHTRRVKNMTDVAEALPEHQKSLLSLQELHTEFNKFRLVSFGQLSSSNPIFEPKAIFNIKTQAVTRYYLDYSGLVADLKSFAWNGRRIALCAGGTARAKALKESLKNDGVHTEISNDFTVGCQIIITTYTVQNGFNIAANKLVVVGTDELLGKRAPAQVSKPKKDVAAPKAGDYVVHAVHGIGICIGTTRIKTDDIEKEYISLSYAGGDSVHIPIDQISIVEPYSGSDKPALSKLGGKEFARIKERVKQSVKKMAIDLLELYSKREQAKGFQYSPNGEWQAEFEDEFPYAETPDQLSAIEAVYKEMESGKVMDRLICGDVGFGKTEVALRAMFKTVMDGKQAALLSPTTILARQHYNTLCARLQPFGIGCEILSRFQGSKENSEALKRLASGKSLLVIATHRLLSQDVKFHDLGLLVLDEEQRFGVQHKEKLKLAEENVNVLTLSATPIPRTLNMALSGIRDISLLETPPMGRLPIQTYITEYSEGLVKDAVERETARGGQVFILYNRVETIDGFAAKVRALLDPSIRIIIAHGQLKSDIFEERVSRFYNGEAEVLIATTIIENGIDLPSANTLIVVDADMFGLAQLHQLRGRVGRSGVLAHAYFTIKPGKTLSEDAVKRLTALTEYTEFGSGYKIALRDLEIRGAGTMLGAEQHGHIEKVGYHMYIKLLQETIFELKGGKPQTHSDVELRIDADMYIKDNYVSDRDKLRVYKQTAAVQSFKQRDELVAEIRDIYGEPERPLINLINAALLKNLAATASVKKITVNKNGAGILFNGDEIYSNPDIIRTVAAWNDKVVLSSTIPPQLTFNVAGLDGGKKIERLLAFFKEVQEGTV
ncbi:MAG: transcription-repair coupling factor [Clostridiaceae bacterium]|jgi:transcription-repair coupling factor (superfamily II helicase)|nr:transcription-repair coupling factor [Clostridiaceae bacterium]